MCIFLPDQPAMAGMTNLREYKVYNWIWVYSYSLLYSICIRAPSDFSFITDSIKTKIPYN